jgi:hypothetical protein
MDISEECDKTMDEEGTATASDDGHKNSKKKWYCC